MTGSEEPVRRLHHAAGRLRAAADRIDPDRRTGADPATGEQWEAGQVLAHCAEMIPYWTGEIEELVARGGDARFGRVKSDPERIARIEAGRFDDREKLLARIDARVDVVAHLLGRLTGADLAMVGQHATLGSMTVAEIVTAWSTISSSTPTSWSPCAADRAS